MNLVLTLIAITAVVLGSGMALPQARHLYRSRRVEGVSATWIGVSAALNGWWIAYAIAERIWVLLPVSAVSAALYVTIGWFFVRATGRRGLTGVMLGGLVLGMVPLPFLLAGGWMVAGVAIGFSYGLQLLPAVVAACRTRALAGVSAATWLIAWAEAMLWSGYGLGIADAALITGGSVGAAMSAVILVRLAVTGHQPLQVITRVARPVLAR